MPAREGRKSTRDRPLNASGWLGARGGLFLGQHVLKQRSKLGSVQPRKSHQTGVQLLQLCLRKRVEIDATNTLLRPRALQPAEKDLGGSRIGNSALAKTTFDLRI